MRWLGAASFDLAYMVSQKGKGALAAQPGGFLMVTRPMITNETMARTIVDVNVSLRLGIPGLVHILHRNTLVIGAEMKLNRAGGIAV